jgi:hypothetical protein
MISNNVILFPKNRTKSDNFVYVSEEEIHNQIEYLKHKHVQDTIANIAPLIFQQLSDDGFDIMDDEDIESVKMGAFLVESLRSILYKYYDIEHPFQKISDNVFKVEENGLLSMSDTLELVMKIDDKGL